MKIGEISYTLYVRSSDIGTCPTNLVEYLVTLNDIVEDEDDEVM